MADIRFDDRVAIITGAGSGLGKCYALEFAKRGAQVVVNDPGGSLDGSGQNSAAADLVVEEIKAAGGKAVANYDSVASKEGGEHIVRTAVDAFGTVDILVNNAGIIRDKSILKLTEDDWDAVIAVHLKGAFCVTQPALAIMKEKKYGRIVNTASGAGLYGNFGQTNYAAAKMALVGIMNSIVVEAAKNNITCNCIAPIAASRMTENLMPQEILDKLKPEFIAPLVLCLCSEQNTANKMIFNCAGGWFSRTEIICSNGIVLGDGKRDIPPEELMDNWDAISRVDDGKALASLVDTFGYLSGIMS
jgi:NAD(P)-dependent dehydrogenase (short-subunit alcohol dehydrogenase family)